MAMVITGSLIRNARKNKGMSQVQLADGICTQATISSIENQNACTSVEILFAICKKLDVKITDVTKNTRYGDKVFSYIEEDMRNHLYADANKHIDQIDCKKLNTRYLKGKYHCYRGFIELYINDDINEAIYNFNLQLTQYAAEEFTFYQAWSNLGIRLAYQKLGKLNRAEGFIDSSAKILAKVKKAGKHDMIVIVDLYVDIIAAYAELEKYDRALMLIHEILHELTQRDLIYKVDVLAELESKCLYAKGEVVQGTMKQFAAMFIAELRGNTELAEKILKRNQVHIVEMVKNELAKNEGHPTFVK
ncbi:helix-turn-helix domain-containing protein [Lentilactobacillus otakiensis DSM 19908 = JCM 15040]|uniref:Xre family transcriptional regulator n=1 Tax=Lentilactobacillus otakiensis DSM 19908 = JCM 15040 TaxID=1423780 RepID=S4NFI2_9LACO|nr:helix-turn-helix transcriptional regulator [Lentilactobacillus otakiensis]KRL09003.1 helix-turn-helix domain-containing protein [Lentilactobacillus otakiensis DSM 19908 = JCM 15040]MDV3518837.1 helix-turn-helix transcriptional regulator [Lentilactobacillus otakiensis]GAD16002.1 xre family transcriptional regulator [Lentilactobacillus otakiensis DSM 19908 = JCM 15040]